MTRGILLVKSASAHAGGIQGQVLRLAQELAQRGMFNPVLATSNVSSSMARSFADLGFPVCEAALTGKKNIRRAARQIENILKRHDIAVIQSHMFHESLVARQVKKQHPELKHVYRVHTSKSWLPIPTWRRMGHYLLDRMTCRYVDRYIANGRLIADEIVNHTGVSRGRVRVVINGRDSIGQPDKPADPHIPLPASVGMVANLSPRKGHDVLIRALAQLKQKGMVVQARLIGAELDGGFGSNGSSFTTQLKAMARKMGVLEQLVFYGYSCDIRGALEGIAVVVLPSESEGIPNCILEAMSLRKLVIASAVGGVPEIIDGERSGLLHLPADPDALADMLQRVFTQHAGMWQPMRDKAYATWRERFQMETMLQGILDVYRELGVLN